MDHGLGFYSNNPLPRSLVANKKIVNDENCLRLLIVIVTFTFSLTKISALKTFESITILKVGAIMRF